MKDFLAFVIAVLGILAAAPNASQAQEFTFSFGDGQGYYAPGYYGYPYYRDNYYNPGYGYYYYHRRVYYRESYSYYYGPRYRYWRHHDLHEWNHD